VPNDDVAWWRDGVFYQIYVRSFADSNGDGIGDLRGVIEHLDHLGWLGVDGVWLLPVNPSPDLDWGYDVSDYRDIHPDLGDLRTLDELVSEAGSRGIRILLDLVPNHTSDRHPWFVDARSSRAGGAGPDELHRSDVSMPEERGPHGRGEISVTHDAFQPTMWPCRRSCCSRATSRPRTSTRS